LSYTYLCDLLSSLSNQRPKRARSPNARYRTPPTTPEGFEDSNQSADSKKNFRVQFGPPKAAEYEIDGPAGQLTPLPSHVTRERFSMDQKKKTRVEEVITEETKTNSAVLAAWEESFEEPKTKSHRRRLKDRRSSSLFTPSPMLADKGDSDETIITPPRHELASTTPSPSVVVAANLAALRMESPGSDIGSSHDSLSSSTAGTSDALHKGANTLEFRVDLNEFNSFGGAMEESPQQIGPCGTPQRKNTPRSRTPEPTHSDLTPPSANAGLSSIHSVGGALDQESPPGSSPNTHMPMRGRENVTDAQTGFDQASFEAVVSVVAGFFF
jgi:hypothetical protein